jgi:formylglycine-generating enzyme required for sulfatase activity
MSALKSKRVGRGDLLRWAVANRELEGFEAGVVALGFELSAANQISSQDNTQESFRPQKQLTAQLPEAPEATNKIPNIDRDMPSALIVESAEKLPTTERVSLIPASQAGDDKWVELPTNVPVVQSEPLMPWNQLAPKLKKLTATIAKVGVDLPRLSRMFAVGKVVRSVPGKLRRRQIGQTHLWLDRSKHLWPYFPDMEAIVYPLIAQRSKGGVTITNIDLPHGQPVNALTGEVLKALPEVKPGDQVLVLGDANLLLFNEANRGGGRWAARMFNIRRYGARVQLLHPMPTARLGEGVHGNFETLSWVGKHSLPPTPSEQIVSPLDYLLMLASPFVRIEPHLLRALRTELVGHADPALESEFCQHAHVGMDCDAVWVRSEHRDEYFNFLMQQGSQKLLIKLARLAHHHHSYQRPIIWAEEIALFAQLAENLENQATKTSDVDTEWFDELANEARLGKLAVARLVFKKEGGQASPKSTVEASISERFAARLIGRKGQLDIVDDADRHFQTVHAASILRSDGSINALQGFDSALLTELTAGNAQQLPVAVSIYQKGNYLIFVLAQERVGDYHFGKLLRTFFTSSAIHIYIDGRHEKSLTVESLESLESLESVDGAIAENCCLKIANSRRIAIHSSLEVVTLRNIVWPSATRPVAALRTIGGIVVSAFGVDRQYGTYFDLTVGDNLTQRFIWINPGSFQMGSPKGEHDRYDDEGPQHTVQLTQGFWMADTACSQAFWAALMLGENPSHFKGNMANPVENVSWNDAQVLIEKLGGALDDVGIKLMPTLPTEAQWEYACRAGTEGPFSTGETITSEQANFDARKPYRDGENSGEFRNSTVPVKSFNRNAWGLYQMHGNVWEWCNDGLIDYVAEIAVNPGDRYLKDEVGYKQDDDAMQAIRGGSWNDGPRNVRSANRVRALRDIRDQGLGLRLVLRVAGSQQAQGAAGGRGKLAEPTQVNERLAISARDARDKTSDKKLEEAKK